MPRIAPRGAVQEGREPGNRGVWLPVPGPPGKPQGGRRVRDLIDATPWQGAAAGVLASLVMYALLFPTARGAPLPPEAFAERLPGHPRRRVVGFVVQLSFGLFWGVLAGLYLRVRAPPFGSTMTLGLAVGGAAFVTSLAGFLVLGLADRYDWRAWVGHFLNHLVFGLTLGLGLLVARR